MSLHNTFNRIEQSKYVKRGTGLILLHEADRQLLPVLQSAIEQCGYSGTLNNMLWMKTLGDETKLSLVIHYYNDNNRLPLENHARLGRNIIILTANGNNNMKTPIVVNTIYKGSSRNNSNASRFNMPSGTFGATMGCDTMCGIEQRMESELTPRQIKAVQAVQKVGKHLWTKYFVIASPNHQYQLSLLIDSITPNIMKLFESVKPLEKRILVYRFKKDTPADLPCLTEPLKRAGLEVSILFKASNDHWILYYIYVDALLQILLSKFGSLFQALHPWMVGLEVPCWKVTEALLTHPNNALILDDIRYVMEWQQRTPTLGGTPDQCIVHAEDVHKALLVA